MIFPFYTMDRYSFLCFLYDFYLFPLCNSSVDYAAAASVSNLLNEWPNARLVTLHRSGRKRVTSMNRNQTDNFDTNQRGYSSNSGRNLGLNIVGGDGSEATFISHIQPDKPAGLSKRILVGDRLLTVSFMNFKLAKV